MADRRTPDEIVLSASEGLAGEHVWRFGDIPVIRNDIARAVLQAVPLGYGRNLHGRWVKFQSAPAAEDYPQHLTFVCGCGDILTGTRSPKNKAAYYYLCKDCNIEGWKGAHLSREWEARLPEFKRRAAKPLTVAHTIKALVDTGDFGAIPETEIDGVWYQVLSVVRQADGNVTLDLRPIERQDS